MKQLKRGDAVVRDGVMGIVRIGHSRNEALVDFEDGESHWVKPDELQIFDPIPGWSEAND